MKKELTPLGALDAIAYSYGYDTNIEIIGTALKALEIIKEKNVDILRIKITRSVEQYNERRIKGCRNLTNEEYDLLKEVFACGL